MINAASRALHDAMLNLGDIDMDEPILKARQLSLDQRPYADPRLLAVLPWEPAMTGG
jgi:hypothetical protein